MLVFIDESGDAGIKLESGSSPYFTVTLLIFEDHDEATAADARITLLKREMGFPDYFEGGRRHGWGNTRAMVGMIYLNITYYSVESLV